MSYNKAIDAIAMSDLYIEDEHHLRAAKGWVQLGNHLEAFNELEKITPRHRANVEVLEVRWQIYTMAGRHDCALRIAEALVERVPERYPVWIWRSHSLNGLGRTQDAVDALVPAATKFPTLGIIPLEIACYYGALGPVAGGQDLVAMRVQLSRGEATEAKSAGSP